MPVTASGRFELARVGVNSAGELTVAGLAWPGEPRGAAAVFIVVGRKTGAEREYPAVLSGEGQPLEAVARIPLADLELPGEGLGDVYFADRSGGRETRTRVTWEPGTAGWLPYPTKLGNLSLKRKDS